MKSLSLVLSVIWVTIGATALVAQRDDIAHFRITVSGSREPIALACEEGCAWKTLTFMPDPNGTVINEYGMRAADAGGDTRRFVIRVGSAGDRIALTCETGCAWKALEFVLTPVPAVVTRLGKVGAVAGPESPALSRTDIQLAIDLGRDAKAAPAFLSRYRLAASHAAVRIGKPSDADDLRRVFDAVLPGRDCVVRSTAGRQALHAGRRHATDAGAGTPGAGVPMERERESPDLVLRPESGTAQDAAPVSDQHPTTPERHRGRHPAFAGKRGDAESCPCAPRR